MAVIKRTPDSFFDRGATSEFGAALDATSRAVADGADIIDIGGVKAGPGEEVTIGETLALPVDQRAEGTLATLAVCAWLGARIFRVHDVPATRAALSAVTAMRAPAA